MLRQSKRPPRDHEGWIDQLHHNTDCIINLSTIHRLLLDSETFGTRPVVSGTLSIVSDFWGNYDQRQLL